MQESAIARVEAKGEEPNFKNNLALVVQSLNIS